MDQGNGVLNVIEHARIQCSSKSEAKPNSNPWRQVKRVAPVEQIHLLADTRSGICVTIDAAFVTEFGAS